MSPDENCFINDDKDLLPSPSWVDKVDVRCLTEHFTVWSV